MRKVAKLGIILLAGLIMFVIAYSFAFKGLSDRVIMLGLGIDLLTETGEYEVTAEVIVPGAGSSQEGGTGGSGSRLVRGKGETVSLAVDDIYQHYGKNAVSRGVQHTRHRRGGGEKFGFASTARLFLRQRRLQGRHRDFDVRGKGVGAV